MSRVDRQLHHIEAMLQAWARWSHRGGPKLILAVGVAALLALGFAVANLRFDTSASDMINSALPYRQAELRFKDAFPALAETLVVAIEADTELEADDLAKAVARILEDDPLIEEVFAPTIHPFFEKNGLLYQSEAELDRTLATLAKAAPLLRDLGRTPSVDLLFARLAKGQQDAADADFDTDVLDQLYAEIDRVIRNVQAGGSTKLDWQRVLDGRTQTDGDIALDEPVTRILSITPVFDFASLQPARVVVERVRAAAEAARAETGHTVTIGITGTQALRTEELRSVASGVGFAFATSMVLVAILLLSALRSARMTGIAVGVLLISLCFSLAFAAAFVGALNLVSVAFIVLLVGLGIDFVIHLTMDILNRVARGEAGETALEASIHAVGPALFLAAITTAVAFLSFSPTDFTGMAQLGFISSAGVLIAFAVTMTIVPAALGLLPKPRTDLTQQSVLPHAPRFGRVLRVGVVGLSLAALPVAATLDFNADPMALRDPNSPSVVTFKALTDDPDTTPYRLNQIVGTLDDARDLAERAGDHPLIKRAVSLARFVPDNQGEKLDLIDLAVEDLLQDLEREPAPQLAHNGRADLVAALSDAEDGSAAQRLRASLTADTSADFWAGEAIRKALIGDWSRMVDRITSKLSPDAFDLNDLPPAITRRYVAQDGRYRVEFVPAEDILDTDKRAAFLAAVESFTTEPSGPLKVYFRGAEVIAKSMREAAGIAALAVSGILLMLLGRPMLVAIILVPLVFAAALAGAVNVLLGQSLNFANVIVLPLLIGLGVDSGIHLAIRRRRAVSSGPAPSLYATTTPRAVAYSALTTIAAFGSLSMSAHRGTASMGLMLAVAIACILVTTLTLIPAWTAWFDQRTSPAPKTDTP